MRKGIAFILWTVSAAAQVAPPSAQIRGTVLEIGTNLPVADAEITVESVTHIAGSPANVTAVARAKSDSQGAFRVRLDRLGNYSVRVNKEGYTDDGRNPMRSPPSNQSTVTLDTDNALADTRFLLARPGSLAGRVVDEETGEPVPNLRVHPMALLYANGKPAKIGAGVLVTDGQGQFIATGLRPGNYVIETGPQMFDKQQLLEHFSEEDLKVVDRDYQRSYWPGGGGLDLALPVQVVSGGAASVGTIKARKVPFYRIHVSLPATGCTAGEKVRIDSLMLRFIGTGGGGEASCGKDYLLRNFEPGNYLFYFLSGTTPENRMRVILPLEVTNKNLELTAPLGRGVDIDGRVTMAEGATSKPPMEKLRVYLRTTGELQFTDEGLPAPVDGEGRFRFPNRPLARAQISIGGLAAGYDVREIRYNGSAVSDNIVTPNASAAAHSLEIVVDDKPALIAGVVAEGDTPVGRPHVVLIRWPVSLEDVFLSAKTADGDEKGRYQFAGLAPGEYRILAVSPTTAGKLDEPRVLERLLSHAERITLTAGSNQTLPLKVTDPAR